MKYPAILKNAYLSARRRQVVIAYSGNLALHIEGLFKGKLSRHYETRNTKNITHEYLANTYGEVLSPEHAEFIIELAENTRCAGVDICKAKTKLYNVSGMYFNFYIDNGVLWLSFHNLEMASNRGEKQITIPLPPKQIQTATPEEEFEMTQIEKNNGDNLMLGGADKCKEWPCAGDKVCWSNGKRKGELKSICDGWAWIKDDSGEFVSLMAKFIKKPKTPEEELRDDIGVYLCEKYNFITGAESLEITDTLLMKYNITKKPQ